MKWTKQEEMTLKQLVERHGKGDWEKITKQFNSLHEQGKKTLQQCRDKYQDIFKVNVRNEQTSVWTEEEQNLLQNLYLQRGPTWSTFLERLPNKTIKSIKNKFYNNLRQFCKKFVEYQLQKYGCRYPLTYENIIVYLELCNKIQEQIKMRGYTISQKSIIFRSRKTLLNLSFEIQHMYGSSNINQMISDLKIINGQLKCLGIFKNNNRKAWQINQQRFKFILDMDTVIENQQQILSQRFRDNKKKTTNKQTINRTQQVKLEVQDQDQENIILPLINKVKVQETSNQTKTKVEETPYNFMYELPYLPPMFYYPYW